jgi:hypothetical protein
MERHMADDETYDSYCSPLARGPDADPKSVDALCTMTAESGVTPARAALAGLRLLAH